MTSHMKIKLGSRASALALKQAHIVQEMLENEYPGIEVEIIEITTTGDSILNTNLAEIGGKGLFIKEIEEHLQEGNIDIAVHSLKDMPAIMPDIFDIPCVLERADVRDTFISTKYNSILELPDGAILGTSSSRRASQALNVRPDLKIIPLRGNIITRISKLKDGVADATFLAMAGLTRVEIFDKEIMHPISIQEMLPAISQGAIGIEILSDNDKMRELLKPLNHMPSYICTKAERSFMGIFEGSCTTPIAALAEISEDQLSIKCLIAKPDGSVIHRISDSGNINYGEKIAKICAHKLKDLVGENFFG
jgi:hydroxymethylbilane synthase